MAREVLSNGVINPDKYQADWYADLSNNWNLLNNLIGSAISSSEVDSKIATAIQELMIRTFQIVTELPVTGTEGVMYLVSIPDTSKYTAYVWENNAYRELGVIQMTITIDDELSTTSENPLQNKVTTNALNGKANISHTHSASDITSGLATVATSGSYNDLSNKPTIPTVNNATLTIQQNGTNVQTFTANQSTNATANITVPTKTSDLTNDSGFITSDNTKIPLAGSNQISGDLIPASSYTVDLGSSTNRIKNIYANNVTVIGGSSSHYDFKNVNYTAGNTVPSSMSHGNIWSYDNADNWIGAFQYWASANNSRMCRITVRDKYSNGALDPNGSFISTYFEFGLTSDVTKYIAWQGFVSNSATPLTTNTYNQGSPSLQWNNTYTRNILIDNDINIASSLINKTSNSGVLTMRGGISDTEGASLSLYGKNYGGSPGLIGNIHMTAYGNSDYTNFRIYPNGIISVYNNSTATTKNVAMQEDVIPLAGSNQISGSLIPATTDAYDLGTSTNKWETINGINPGALSLPSGAYINVDTTNWDLTCQNELLGSFTPTADGWLMLHIANSGSNEVAFWIIGGVIRINNKSSINTTDNNNFNMFTIPVEKDVTYKIYGNASEYVAGRSIRYCRFMPCRGNI